MGKTEKIVVSRPKNKELKLPCTNCANETVHSVLSDAMERYTDAGGRFTAITRFDIVQCGGCREVSFCKEQSNSEDVDINDDGEQYNPVSVTVFPPRLNGRKLVEDLAVIPHGIAGIYKEMHSALCNGNYVLTGIGIRALLEAVVNDKKASGKSLSQKITSLIAMGLITKDGAEILHSIRILGNKAAHEVVANSLSELNAAIDVVEHLMASVYIIPQKARVFKSNKIVTKPPSITKIPSPGKE